MLRFIIEFVVFFGFLMLCTVPVWFVAARVKRRIAFKKWVRAAAILAFITAGLGWSSRDLQQSCLAEVNRGCIDIGGVGTQFLLLGGFATYSLGYTYLMWRD